MLIWISGQQHAIIEPLLMIFKSRDRNYPIKGVPDNIAGTAYRTGPKRWKVERVMKQWICVPCVIKELHVIVCAISLLTIAVGTTLLRRLSPVLKKLLLPSISSFLTQLIPYNHAPYLSTRIWRTHRNADGINVSHQFYDLILGRNLVGSQAEKIHLFWYWLLIASLMITPNVMRMVSPIPASKDSVCNGY